MPVLVTSPLFRKLRQTPLPGREDRAQQNSKSRDQILKAGRVTARGSGGGALVSAFHPFRTLRASAPRQVLEPSRCINTRQ